MINGIVFFFGKRRLTLSFSLNVSCWSDFYSLLFFGNYFRLEIFSLGNSARTRGENAWELSNWIALEWALCTYYFFEGRGYFTHIVGVRIESDLTTHSPSPFPVLKTGKWKYPMQSISHTESPGRQIQETNINADFQEFLFHFSLCRLSLNLVVLHPDTSLFRSSKILKCRNRVVFISNVFYKPSTRAWDKLAGIVTHHFGRMLSTNTGGKIEEIFSDSVLECCIFFYDFMRKNMDHIRFNSPAANFITCHYSRFMFNSSVSSWVEDFYFRTF